MTIDNCSLEEVYSSTTEENKSMNKTVSDSSTYGIAMFSHLSQGQSSAPHYIERYVSDAVKQASQTKSCMIHCFSSRKHQENYRYCM
jgi:hypothetical protein